MDGRRHGRGEQRHLAGGAGCGEDLFDVLLKAHLEHFVCFIEHHVAQVLQFERTALEVVDDAAGRSDDNLSAALKAGQLRGVGLSAVDRQNREVGQVRREARECFGHLDRQFPGGSEDERERAVVGTSGISQVSQHRQGERGGLAGSRLGQADDVTAFQQQRDGLRLNGRGGFEAEIGDRGENGGVEVEFGELRAVLLRGACRGVFCVVFCAVHGTRFCACARLIAEN